DGKPSAQQIQIFGDSDPAGALHTQENILYECWLFDEERPEGPDNPGKLFQGSCDHVGYVAANLAVRWHPAENRIYFVERTANHRHTLFDFDVATKQTRQVFPHTADALLFDWTPDGTHLACVLVNARDQQDQSGIWVGKPRESGWWHVPGSADLAFSHL